MTMTMTDQALNLACSIPVVLIPVAFLVLVIIPSALPRRLRGPQVPSTPWDGSRVGTVQAVRPHHDHPGGPQHN